MNITVETPKWPEPQTLPVRPLQGINELATALAKAQGQMKNATLNKTNPHFKSKYADLAAIIEAIRKPLSDNNICWTHTTELRGSAFVLVTRLIHSSGQMLVSERPLPMGKPQEMGSAETYAKRYSLSSLCGIAADEDDDGNVATNGKTVAPARHPTGDGEEPTLTGEQVTEIYTLIKHTNSNIDRFLKWAKAPSLSDIPASKYDEAIALLSAKKGSEDAS